MVESLILYVLLASSWLVYLFIRQMGGYGNAKKRMQFIIIVLVVLLVLHKFTETGRVIWGF